MHAPCALIIFNIFQTTSHENISVIHVITGLLELYSYIIYELLARRLSPVRVDNLGTCTSTHILRIMSAHILLDLLNEPGKRGKM